MISRAMSATYSCGARRSDLQRLERTYGLAGNREKWVEHDFPVLRLAALQDPKVISKLRYLAHKCAKFRAAPSQRCAILSFENDDKDQIHDETARQSRSALGIGLTIREISKFRFDSRRPRQNRGLRVFGR